MIKLRFTLPILIFLIIFSISMGIFQKDILAQTSLRTIDTGASVIGKSHYVTGSDYKELAQSYRAEYKLSEIINANYSSKPVVNDPFYNQQWPLKQIHFSEIETIGIPEYAPVLVAVLDTGIDCNHEDLSEKVVIEINLSDSISSSDLYGHGTFVAGIIGANTNNGIGIAGVAPECRIMDVKVADDNGQCWKSTIARGIIWATDHGAKVINISIEMKTGSSELENAVDYAWRKGAIIVAATSNTTSEPVYPAFYRHCISVVASDMKDQLGQLSGYENWVDIAAPGISVYSTLPDNSYGYKTGTSFATAHVSGMAAVLFNFAHDSNGDGKINDEISSAIENGVDKTVSSLIGRIDALKSFSLLNSRS
jgi:thermitase